MSNQAPFALRTRNPDVLTCIANLSNDEVFTPPELANKMLDTLTDAWAENNDGASVWADKTVKFLDPGTKSGVFLREITRRLTNGLEEQIPSLEKRVSHILTKQVFGLGITKITSLLARRSLYCSKRANGKHSIAKSFSDEDGNIWFERTHHDWKNGRCHYCGAPQAIFDRGETQENHAYAFIHSKSIKETLAKAFGGEMQFDVIIGNPPYQMTGGGGGSNDSSIYPLFVEQAIRLEPRYLSMVIPSRWMAGGRGMEDFRKTMLTSQRLSHLVDYPNSAQVFPSVDLKSGVCYFLWNQGHKGPCAATLIRGDEVVGPTKRNLDEYDVFIRDERAAKILKKVLQRNEQSFSDLLTGDTPFGLPTNFKDFRPGKPRAGEVTVYASSNLGRRTGVMRRSLITKNTHLIDAWKVLVPQAGPGNSGGHVLPDQVLGKPMITEPNSVCTQTWIVVGPLKTKKNAEVIARYLQTSFARFMVSLRKISQHAMRGVYQWLPQQDWNVDWTDEALFKKYEITKSEVEFINRMIRPMNDDESDE
jgi:site-specific DNA-methyltransferase (adenine-specific)